MKTFVIQSFNFAKTIKKQVLILVISLFSFPAMALLSGDIIVEITDDCCRCGLCEATYPDSFYIPDQGKAQILLGYNMVEIMKAEQDCPSEAIIYWFDYE